MVVQVQWQKELLISRKAVLMKAYNCRLFGEHILLQNEHPM